MSQVSAVTVGEVTIVEHDLLCRGLENLRKALLEEAGALASQKLSRKQGSFANVALEGRKRLDEIKVLNDLYARLKALVRAETEDPSQGD